MKNKVPLAIAFIAAAIALTVVSLILLPDTVVTQLSLGGSGATTMPKPLAVALPALLTFGGSVAYLLGKKDNAKTLLVSVVGIVVFAIMLFVNLL